MMWKQHLRYPSLANNLKQNLDKAPKVLATAENTSINLNEIAQQREDEEIEKIY